MSFEGEIGPFAYGLTSIPLFLTQYALVGAVFAAERRTVAIGWRLFFFPWRTIADIPQAPPALFALAIAASFLFAWGLALLAFRRATNAGVSGWFAALIFAPVLQIVVMTCLAVIPPRARKTPVPADDARPPLDWKTAAQGMLAGMGVTVATVAIGALLFGSYGYGMFVLGPVLIGATTAYIANRQCEISAGSTAALVLAAAALGGLALIGSALEGAVCIVLASPLVAVSALIGGLIGTSIATSASAKARHSLMSVSFLPILFVIEHAFPPSAEFIASQSTTIAAPPGVVWRSLVRMDQISTRPILPFRLGVAYPIGAWIVGGGVGAKRVGLFSTGVAIERITQWVPGRILAFDVLRDPPAMHEMSPYRHVNAPHVEGYFQTHSTSFELTPLRGGRTRLTLRSTHELKLDPVPYWLPLARWVVDQNDARVLRFLQLDAEEKVGLGPGLRAVAPSPVSTRPARA